MVARNFGGDERRTADHLNEPVERVRAARSYYAENSAEVDERLALMDTAAETAAQSVLT